MGKNITYLARTLKKLCLVFDFICIFISKVSIKTQNETNASLMSALVVISNQNVRVARMKGQCSYHVTNPMSKDICKFNVIPKHLS